jgi:large repetitive protein
MMTGQLHLKQMIGHFVFTERRKAMTLFISRFLQVLMITALLINPVGRVQIQAKPENCHFELHFSTDDSINNGVGEGKYEVHFTHESESDWFSLYNLNIGDDANALALAYGVTPQNIDGKVFNGFIVETIVYHSGDGSADVDGPKDLYFIGILAVYTDNTAPSAIDDSYSTSEDEPLTMTELGVLSNDYDPESNALSAYLDDGPSHGDLTFNLDGSFTYTPDQDYFGSDQFTYHNNDGVYDSNVATVYITIGSVNDLPIANDDAFTLLEGGTKVDGQVSGSDLESSILSFILISDVSHGVLVFNTDGTYVYTHDGSEFYSDGFSFVANDGDDNSTLAQVEITIINVNDAPIANDDVFTNSEDQNINFSIEDLLLNDYDAEEDELSLDSYVNAIPSSAGILTYNLGLFTFTPADNWYGSVDFTYRLSDGIDASNIATVTLTISAENDAPVAEGQSVITNEDTAIDITLVGHDIEEDDLEYSLVDTPIHGDILINGNVFEYTPDENYLGLDSFTFKVNDGSTDSNVATVYITVNAINDQPVAYDQNLETNEDTALNISLTGFDVDLDDLIFEIIDPVLNGSLEKVVDVWVYTPNEDFNGIDGFTFRVSDGVLYSELAEVVITVHPINDAPVANDNAYSTDEDTALVILSGSGVLMNDEDVDEDLFEVYDFTQTTYGDLVLNADGSFTYTPELDFNGQDSFIYRIIDENETISQSGDVTIDVGNVNDIPTADDQALTTAEDTALVITLTGDDAEDLTLDYNVLTQPTNGVLSGVGSTLTYTPNLNYVGTDSFNFQAEDSEEALSDIATISITITAVNDAPVAVPSAFTVANAGTYTGLLSGTDVEGSALTYILSALPANGALTLVGNAFTYIHNGTATLSDGFSFIVNDGTLDSTVASVTITILAAPAPTPTPTPTPAPTPTPEVIIIPTPVTPLAALNTAPIADDQNTSTLYQTVLVGQVSAYDPNADALVFSVVSPTDHGILIFNADGSYRYTPNAGYVGNDSFSFIASDGELDSNIAIVIIGVEEPILIEEQETPLAALPQDNSWLYWLAGLLAGLLILYGFVRPNIKYRLIQKNGQFKTLYRRFARPDQTDLFIDLDSKGLDTLTDIDVLIYRRLAKHLKNVTVHFTLERRLVHKVTLPKDIDEDYQCLIHL